MAIDWYPPAASRSRLLPLVTVLACAMLAACGAAPVAELTATPSGRAVAGGLPQSPQEAQELREKLHLALFGTSDLSGATTGTTHPVPVLPPDLPPLIRAYTANTSAVAVPLKYRLTSTVDVLTPKKPGSCVLIWAEGHSPKRFEGGGDAVVSSALRSGCRVAVLDMPWKGRNVGQAATLPDGRIVDPSRPEPYALHDDMRLLDTAESNAVGLFVAPSIGLVDYFQRTIPDVDIMMAGLSGGGWTTTISAAADPRIRRSMEVAGSEPISDLSDCVGDYEQCNARLFSQVGPEQLYALAAIGTGRSFVQVLNFNDPCCFAGITGETYARAVQESVAASGGGSYRMISDRTLRLHAIPAVARRTLSGWAADPEASATSATTAPSGSSSEPLPAGAGPTSTRTS